MPLQDQDEIDKLKKYARWVVENKDKAGTEEFDAVYGAFDFLKRKDQGLPLGLIDDPEQRQMPEGNPENQTFGGHVEEIAKGIPRGLVNTGLGALSGTANTINALTGRGHESPHGFIDWVDSVRDSVNFDSALARDEDYQDAFSGTVGEGIGSMLAFLAPGGLAAGTARFGAAGVARAATAGAVSQKAAKAAGLGSTWLATQSGSDDQRMRMKLAEQSGEDISDLENLTATIAGNAIGWTEKLGFGPLERILTTSKIPANVPLKEMLGKAISEVMGRAVVQGTLEGTQEIAALKMQEIVEKLVYNPNMEPQESAWEEFGAGAIAGALMQGVLGGAGVRSQYRAIRDLRTQNEEQRVRETEYAQRLSMDLEAALGRREAALADPQIDPSTIEMPTDGSAVMPQSFDAPIDPSTVGRPGGKGQLNRYARFIHNQMKGAFPTAQLDEKNAVPDTFEVRQIRTNKAGNPVFAPVISKDGNDIAYGTGFTDIKQALKLKYDLDKEAVSAGRYKEVFDQIVSSPEAYNPGQRDALARLGARLMEPRSNLVSASVLDAATETTADKGFDSSVPAKVLKEKGTPKKKYSSSQQVNRWRIEQGLPETNAFTLEELRQSLGKDKANRNIWAIAKWEERNATTNDKGYKEPQRRSRYKPVRRENGNYEIVDQKNNVVIDKKLYTDYERKAWMDVAGRKFKEVDVIRDGTRAKSIADDLNNNYGDLSIRDGYLREKPNVLRKSFQNLLTSRNITSDLSSPEVKTIFKSIVGRERLGDMSNAEKRIALNTMKRMIPVFPEPTKLVDYSPKAIEKSKAANKTEAVLALPSPSQIKKATQEIPENAPAPVAEQINDLNNSRLANIFVERLKQIMPNKEVAFELFGKKGRRAMRLPNGEMYYGVRERKTLPDGTLEPIQAFDKSQRKPGVRGAIPVDPEGKFVYDNTDTEESGRYSRSMNKVFLTLGNINRAVNGDNSSLKETKDFEALLKNPEFEAELNSVIDHELVHSMFFLDLFTAKEKEILRRRAMETGRTVGGVKMSFYEEAISKIKTEADGVTPTNSDTATEESIAYMIQDSFRSMKDKPKSSINRAKNFIERTYNFLSGTGFQSFDDVMTAFYGGKIGSRDQNTTRTFGAYDRLAGAQQRPLSNTVYNRALAKNINVDEADEQIMEEKAKLLEEDAVATNRLADFTLEEESTDSVPVDEMESRSRQDRARDMGALTDDKGNVVTVYRGEAEEFNNFQKNKLGSTLKTPWSKVGFFFSPSKDGAEVYARTRGSDIVRGYHVGLQNPFRMSSEEFYGTMDWGSLPRQKYKTITEATKAAEQRVQQLKDLGHDGFIVERNGQPIEYVVFDESNIRSVDARFNKPFGESTDIMESRARTGSTSAEWTTSDESIRGAARNYTYANLGKTRAFFNRMPIKDFLHLTTSENYTEDNIADNVAADLNEDGTAFDPSKADSNSPNWLDSGAMLAIVRNADGSWKVAAHEGRHRGIRASRDGASTMPVVIEVNEDVLYEDLASVESESEIFDSIKELRGQYLQERRVSLEGENVPAKSENFDAARKLVGDGYIDQRKPLGFNPSDEAIEKAVQENAIEAQKVEARGEIPRINPKANKRAQYIARNIDRVQYDDDLSSIIRKKDVNEPAPPLPSTVASDINKRIGNSTAVNHDMMPGERAMRIMNETSLGHLLSKFKTNAISRWHRVWQQQDLKASESNGKRKKWRASNEDAFYAALMYDRSHAFMASAMTSGVMKYKNGQFIVDDFVTQVKNSGTGPIKVGGLVGSVHHLLTNVKNEQSDLAKQRYDLARAIMVTRRGMRINSKGGLESTTKEKAEQELAGYLQAAQQNHRNDATGGNYVEEFIDMWYDYNSHTAQFLVDTGVITPEMGEEWKYDAAYYPFYREQDPTFQGKKGHKFFSGLTGSTHFNPVGKNSKNVDLPMLESMAINLGTAIEMGMKNVVQQRVMRDQVDLGLARKTPEGYTGDNTVRFRVNGIEQDYIVDDDIIYQSMLPLEGGMLGKTVQILSKPSKLLREVITRDPAFIVVNALRDTIAASITSGSSFIPVIDTLRGFKGDMDFYERRGVVGGYDMNKQEFSSITKLFQKQYRERYGSESSKDKNILSRAWDTMGDWTTKSDVATRDAVYRDVYNRTGDDIEATIQAIEVINFARKGRSQSARMIASLIPFLNARVQGLDVLYRSMRGQYSADSEKTHRQNTKSFAARASVLMALSSLYWFLQHDEEDYKLATDEQRDNNYIFPSPVEGGAPIRLPIPFEIGILFKVLPERILETMFGNTSSGAENAEAFKRAMADTFKVSPFSVQAFGPAAEALLNYDSFTQEQIVSFFMGQNTRPGLQYTQSTSELAKLIGEQTNISPMKIEHVIEGYLGTMGSYGLTVIDSILRSPMVNGGDKSKSRPDPWYTPSQLPVMKRFFASPRGRGLQQDFYDLESSVREAVSTMNRLVKNNELDKAMAFQRANERLLNMNPYMNSLNRQVTKYREQRDAVMKMNISSQEKREILEGLDDYINQTLDIMPDLKDYADLGIRKTTY